MRRNTEFRKLQMARLHKLIWIVAGLFLVLILRLWYLQIVMGGELLLQSESNRIRTISTRAPRGAIRDCKGREIATSRPQFVVLATPKLLMGNAKSLNTLCRILAIKDSDFKQAIMESGTIQDAPIRVAVDVPLETVVRIGESWTMLPGVSVELDNIRHYNIGLSVCHVIGHLGEISQQGLDQADKEGLDYRPGDYLGKQGLENYYESELRGENGGKQFEVNAFGRAVRVLGDKPCIPGQSLTLTLDVDLQAAADRALGRQVGSVVAIDPRSGAVLAMVSKPEFDPNMFVKGIKTKDWQRIMSNPNRPLQNRAVYNTYPPGSTFKPMVAVAALKNGACARTTTAYCPGHMMLGRRRFGCWKRHNTVDFIGAMAQSCDVWFYQTGLRLHIDRMAALVKQFGIGKATGIDLPGEGRRRDLKLGNMPDPEWKRRRRHEHWYQGDTLNTSIGQGDVLVSPLQMATACAAIANGGRVYRPFLVREIRSPDGAVLRATSPTLVSTVDALPENFRLVQQGMRATVERGTGKVCNMTGIAVAGKTGSAQVPHKPAHAWFICFAPADNPTIAIAAIVENGRHGATAAAPVCRAILDIYFGKKKPHQIKQFSAKTSGD